MRGQWENFANFVSLKTILRYCFQRNTATKTKFSHCQKNSRLEILNSTGVTNVA